MNAELQWKRLQTQQANADEHRLKLEEEIQKLRCEAEVRLLDSNEAGAVYIYCHCCLSISLVP